MTKSTLFVATGAALSLIILVAANPAPAAGDPRAKARIRAVLARTCLGSTWRMQNVPPDDGRLLRVLAAAFKSKRALEIGTSNGCSGLWIALGLLETGGTLVTLEIDPRRVALARKNFQAAGVFHRVRVIQGDALATLKGLSGPFDFVFIDADKSQYGRYLELIYPKLAPGGVILAHNVVDMAHELRGFFKKLKKYPDLVTVIARERGSGISLTYRLKRPGTTR
ncbi:MAG: O-methyltransferase [Proteobacteria bacterium]|nr:O-methyltransferase [Pseudomonadota bacterium]